MWNATKQTTSEDGWLLVLAAINALCAFIPPFDWMSWISIGIATFNILIFMGCVFLNYRENSR